jgi:hypothetical protein
MIKRGFPPAYAEGYADGCSSGGSDAGGVFDETRKDMTRYGTDRRYTRGWDNAFQQFRSDMAAIVASDQHASGDHSKH